MTDMINPNHYKGDRQFEPIAVIEDWKLNYRLGNALKYIARNGRKPGEDPREGLKKAIWYIEREIASLDAPSPYAPPADAQYDDVLQSSERIRIYELAHELGLSNRDVFEACDSLGIEVKAHSSSLKGSQAWQVRAFLSDRVVSYEDVLEYYGQSVDLDEAWPVPFDASEDVPVFNLTGFEPVRTETSTFLESTVNRVTEAQASDWSDFWDSDEDYMWDPSLGPVELSDEEVHEVLKRKDLEQFSEDEIVSTIEKRGFVLGVKKDGSTCVLKDGRCEQ